MPIRVGIGGWTFEPWRGPFYPAKLPHAQELHYASRQVTTIEINGTFYRNGTPDGFRRWAEATPDDFVFSIKAPRTVVNRRVLAEAGPSIERFMASGLDELGPKLGPILWQLAPTKVFDPDDLAAFLDLLPDQLGKLELHHVLEVRHESFRHSRLAELLAARGIALVLADSAAHPTIAALTGKVVYARLQRARDDVATGYDATQLACWAARMRCLAGGLLPDDLPQLHTTPRREALALPCYVYMINGAKVRAPAAAMAMLERLRGPEAG